MTQDTTAVANQTSQIVPDEDVSGRPWTNADDLTGWEAVADSAADGPMGFVVRVTVEKSLAATVVQAARAAGMDVPTFVQRILDERLHEMVGAEHSADPANAHTASIR